MLTIRKAVRSDLNELWTLVRAAIEEMNRSGNNQWGADYPILEDYAQALDDGQLYAACGETGAIRGVAVFNTAEEPQYSGLNWLTQSPALVIHKVAVDPSAQRTGAASALFQFAFELARSRGLASVRIDTYSLNQRMQALIRKQGFSFVGEIYFPAFPDRPLPFRAFEKIL